MNIRTDRFARFLQDKGVKKGDRVTIYMPMIPEAVISMLARNFEVERVDHGPVDEHLVVTMRPDNLAVRLRRRVEA